MPKSTDIVEVEKKIIFQGAYIAIRQDTILYRDGTHSSNQILQAPEGALVLPVTPTGKIILTQEYRHNHGKIYGVPMGKIDQGEDPLSAAKRELSEEVGLQAKKWTHISTHHNGVHEEGLNYYFIAEDLIQGESSPELDEEIELIEMTFQEAFALMNQPQSRFVDLRSRGCIWAAYVFLQERKQLAKS